jgi:hypothetical protein
MDRSLLAAASLLFAMIAQPASAQALPTPSSSKTEAILGGPSKLAALIAQQSGER